MAIESFAIKNNLKPFVVNEGRMLENKSYSYKLPSIEHWLKSFNDAEYVITDSFHGTVFSILFHKPFICVGNKDRGMSRFHSLLKMFGLENRLVDVFHIKELSLNGINWDSVDEILSLKRDEAMSFIKRALDSQLNY